MGCFGYICKHCNTPVRGDCFAGGEKCVLIHVRNGVELGRVEGHYNEYGGIFEQKGLSEDLIFRGYAEGINGHSSICDSELRMPNSYLKVIEMKAYENKNITFPDYVKIKLQNDLKSVDYNIRTLPYFSFIEKTMNKDSKDLLQKVLGEFDLYIDSMQNKSFCNENEIKYLLIKLQMYANDISYFISYFINPGDKTGFYEEYNKLPNVELENYSGIVAYHSKCYKQAVKTGTFSLVPSKSDPNQSWGKVRQKYK